MQNKHIKYINKVKRPIIGPCPCAVDHLSCGYVVISHILGCPYNCTYCFLHTFYGKDEIVVYNNERDILAQLSRYLASAKKPLRVGTGQYSDSLAMPEAVSLGVKLVNFFAEQDQHIFELKTKSALVDKLLDLEHKGRTVVAWSVNPQNIAKSEELGAPGLTERIQGAKKCCQAGYPVAFHFDPIIFYPDWDKDYREVVDLIFSEVDPQYIAWISLGALRYAPELKSIIAKHFPHSRIISDKSTRGEDGKMRYPESTRIEIFKKMNQLIRAHSKDVYLYLCMENIEVWKRSKIENSENNPFGRYFSYFEKKTRG
ncbi:MAG: DNA photolyase [Candidatus Saganbacteria bacterium]|nr:DNA photolyase [Candidatus Saganbacteria bacterium]